MARNTIAPRGLKTVHSQPQAMAAEDGRDADGGKRAHGLAAGRPGPPAAAPGGGGGGGGGAASRGQRQRISRQRTPPLPHRSRLAQERQSGRQDENSSVPLEIGAVGCALPGLYGWRKTPQHERSRCPVPTNSAQNEAATISQGLARANEWAGRKRGNEVMRFSLVQAAGVLRGARHGGLESSPVPAAARALPPAMAVALRIKSTAWRVLGLQRVLRRDGVVAAAHHPVAPTRSTQHVQRARVRSRSCRSRNPAGRRWASRHVAGRMGLSVTLAVQPAMYVRHVAPPCA
ncbi:hypothetical protein FQR65_LT17245 [Abscondita terminalis]|nr:hypothetical protein FQR65_LT17245 [Abscondita terminalis]